MFVIAPGDKRQEVTASVRCHDLSGRVGEWLKPADCKSAAPCGRRRFEPPPVHHLIASPMKPRITNGAFCFFNTLPFREIRWSKAIGVSVSNVRALQGASFNLSSPE